MCYNIAAKSSIKALQKKYGIKIDIQMTIQTFYQVSGFAHPKLPVLAQEQPSEFSMMQWGLIPAWAKGEEKAIELSNIALNARAETIFDKPMFRNSIASRRCILPVDGFYEWRKSAKVNYPYYIYPKDKDLFSLGCVYDIWPNTVTGELISSFSIITTEANEVMAMINSKKRMPLQLNDEDWRRWLDPTASQSEIQALLKPAASEALSFHTISRKISNHNLDSNYPEIQTEVNYPELEEGYRQNTLF